MRVYRWSDGSYLEDQDMWFLSGIFRDVYLFSTPAVHMRDFWAQHRAWTRIIGTPSLKVRVNVQQLRQARRQRTAAWKPRCIDPQGSPVHGWVQTAQAAVKGGGEKPCSS